MFEFLKSLESTEMPLLGPNYWFLKKTCLILPNTVLGKVIAITVHETAMFFVFTQYVELLTMGSDLDLVLTNLKMSMLSFVCGIKSNTFIIWQSRWKDVIRYVTDADKYERTTNDPIRRRILNSYTKYCRLVTFSYWGLLFTTVSTTIANPLIHYLTSGETYREGVRNGTELFPHIFSSWMPLDKNHAPGIWITVIWQILICIYGGSIMSAFDTTAMVIMVYFSGNLELLRERCKQMLGTDGQGVSDDVASERVREFHRAHVLIMRYSRFFNSMLSPVMFIYIIMCTLMLCASIYQLTSATDTGQTLLMAEFLIFGVTQLFVFCWHSNDVLAKYENVMLGPYESEWWAANVRQRKCVLLLAGQLSTKQMFTAGPFTDLTLSTFVTILKGAYSYYTLVRK